MAVLSSRFVHNGIGDLLRRRVDGDDLGRAACRTAGWAGGAAPLKGVRAAMRLRIHNDRERGLARERP